MINTSDFEDQTHFPLVSVVINCFNGEKWLSSALQSVLAQDYPKFEIIFWDNCSSDSSCAVAESFYDPRIKILRATEHTSLYCARAEALKSCTGEIITFLDVDDTWEPSKLSLQVHEFRNPSVSVLHSNYWIQSKRKRRLAHRKPLPSGAITSSLLSSYSVGLLTLAIRRSVLDQAGLSFDSRFHIIGDFDLVMRLALTNDITYLPQPTGTYRLHASNQMRIAKDRHVSELLLWWRENCENGPYSELDGRKGFYRAIKYEEARSKISNSPLREVLSFAARNLGFIPGLKIIIQLLLSKCRNSRTP